MVFCKMLCLLSFMVVLEGCQDNRNNVRNDKPESEETNKASIWDNMSYNTYVNPRFGYSIDYPSEMKETHVPDNDDGRVFEYNELTITVSGMYNATDSDVKSMFEMSHKSSDTYTVVRNNWFVCSGVNNKGNIYYQKTILNNDTWYTVILDYPKSMKEELDNVVNRVTNSFRFFEVRYVED